MPADDERNQTFARLRPEIVAKPDGRYLIYYSWDDDSDQDDGVESGEHEPANRAAHPDQQPWTPQGGPADV